MTNAAVQAAAPIEIAERGWTLPIGASGPAFRNLLGTDGRRHSLADYADARTVVLLFTANRCPTAKGHTERLRDLQARYGPRGVQLVLVNSNEAHLYPEETYQRMVERAAKDGLSIPYLHDADQAVARAYGPDCTFHAFVLDEHRTLRYEGRIDDARLAERVTSTDLADAIDDVLADRPVRVPRTDAYGCSLDILPLVERPSGRAGLVVGLLAGGAWLLTGAAELTGTGHAFHHDALIEGGPLGAPPLVVAVGASLLAWLVMVAAMMLPASASAIGTFERALMNRPRANLEWLGFGAAFAAAWSTLGVVAFFGDDALHHIVDATPWLAERPFLVQASVLILAGAYQLAPLKRTSVAACRDPETVRSCCATRDRHAGLIAGLLHARDCLGASWALMVAMFAAGFANLGWMVALTALMVYEVRGRHGLGAASAAGVVLIGLGAVVALTRAVVL